MPSGVRRRGPSKPRLSPTRLNTYRACPRQYYFAYVRRMPRRARSYFSFGTSLHGALQDFHRDGGARTQPVEQLLSQLEDSWVKAGYRSEEEQAAQLDLGQQMLTAYYEAAEEQQAETLFVEKMLSAPQDGFILTGRVDRVDRRPDGALEVVDYKSGSYLPTMEELENDLAVAIYQLLVSQTLATAPVMGTIYNLRANKGISLIRDQAALDNVAAEVNEWFVTLSSDTDFEARPGQQCKHCDFAPHCAHAQEDVTDNWLPRGWS